MLRTAGLLALAGAVAGQDPVVHIPGIGAVSGVAQYGEHQYLGIPYAAPPVGDLRWQPPTEHAAWNETRPAKAFGGTCLQNGIAGVTCAKQSEDCLFLNVFAPADPAPAGGLPVMVWIHGGAYTTGCSNMYNRQRQANQSVIFVSVNYRLNVFGFAGSKDLATAEGGTGNYGIQDQRLALQWVRKNIAAFGGDPKNVLIHGESAGGNSMVQHLTQPKSFGLYDKVIIESGTYQGSLNLSAATATFGDVLDKLSCSKDRSGIECARAVSGKDLSKAAPGLLSGYGPVIDGVNLHALPADVFDEGKHNTKVPVVLGSNRDEIALFMALPIPGAPSIPKQLTEEGFDEQLAGSGITGDALAKVKKLYSFNGSYPYPSNLGSFSEWWWMAMRVSTDTDTSLGACSVRRTARALVKAGNPAVYTYLFAHPGQVTVMGVKVKTVYAGHAMEIPYVMNCGTMNQRDCKFGDPESAVLAQSMSDYWYRFAAGSDPNGAGAAAWPKYSADGDALLRFDVASAGGVVTQTGLRKDACDFWDVTHTPPPGIY